MSKSSEAKAAELEAKIKSVEAERKLMFIQKEPIDARIRELYNELRGLRDQLDTIRAATGNSWSWLLQEDGNGSTVKHNERDKKLAKIGLGSTGYFDETEQVCIRISLTKGSKKSFNATVKGLKFILPYLKPIGNKIPIDIFEETLSEHGVYKLKVDKDMKKSVLTKTCYSMEMWVEKFNTIEEAVLYIQQNHWYDEEGR